MLQNFMSFKDQNFDGLDHPGLTLIEGNNLDEGGSNGSGKSTIWDAISWCLFGQTVRGLKGDDVIHRGESSCRVSVAFTLRDTFYVVIRNRKDPEFDNRLLIRKYSNDRKKFEDLERGTLALTQDFLGELMGIDFELFRCTVLFAQGETFNFVNETNKRQKEILSKVMRIDYTQLLKQAKENFKEIGDKESELDRKVAVLESHLVEDEDSLFAEEIADWESKRLSKIEGLKEDLKALKRSMDENESEFNKLDAAQAEWKAEADKYNAVVVRHTELDRLWVKISQSIKEATKRYKHYKALAEGGKCPECEQDVSDATFDLSGHKKAIVELVKKEKKIKEELESLPMEERRKFYEEAQKRMERAERAGENYDWYKADYDKKKKQIEDIAKEVNPFEDQKAKAIAKQEDIKKKLEQIAADKKSLDAELPYFQFWVDAFGDAGIKSFVFDLICSTLTNRANHYLNVLSAGSAAVSFDTQKKLKSGDVREKFDCSITMHGEEVSYDSYSGGEKRRVSLAVDMALSDLMGDYYGSSFSMVVFDEQTSYLDRGGREQFMKLLQELGKDKKVFVVDHDAEFKAMFDDVITITKKEGVSHATY